MKNIKKLVCKCLACAMIVASLPGMTLNVSAENIETTQYEYMYAALNWNEYWKSEGVYNAGDNTSSNQLDDRGEQDLGAYDAVSRATTNHGLHRGSFQCSAVILDENNDTYSISHWSEDGKTIYLNNGKTIGFSKGVITKEDGTQTKMVSYTVDGLKYVPVGVEKKDVESFKALYDTVENGETLTGGFSEMQLSSYSETAEVNENTNGLKIAERNENGTFDFSASLTGSGSGLKGKTLKQVDNNNLNVEVKDASGAYGEFLRVDLTGEEYGQLGAALQSVTWKYFGKTDPANRNENPIVTYGTKFAADNWMHKILGIQLGLTESGRCKLPEGTDGTGYWQLQVRALGYQDTIINVHVTSDKIVDYTENVTVDKTALQEKVNEAKQYSESDYTVESYRSFKEEYDEAIELLEKADVSQAEINEQLQHLTSAINALVKKETTTTVKVSPLTNLSIKLYEYNAIKVNWKKVADATGYKVYYKKSTQNNYTYKGTTRSTQMTLSKLSAGTKYNVKVVPYKTVKGKTYTGTYKISSAIYTLKKLNTPKVSKKSSGKVTVSWNNIDGESGYQIAVSTNKKKTGTIYTVNTTTGKTKTVKVSKKKTYYYKVRAYKTVDGKKIYSPWSGLKSYKLK